MSALSRRREEPDDEARPLFPFRSRRAAKRDGSLSAAEIGSAHHLFLQFAAIEQLVGELPHIGKTPLRDRSFTIRERKSRRETRDRWSFARQRDLPDGCAGQ